MKLVKLSLVAALAAGSFSALDAKPLEEAIRGVDLTGTLRYRYEQATYGGDGTKNGGYGNSTALGGYIGETNRPHKFRAFIDPKIFIGDGFTIGGQLMYNNDGNGGWQSARLGGTNTNAQAGIATTKQEIVLKQAYLQYHAGDIANITLGRQQLGTIWTADFTGTAAKAIFTPAKGIAIAGFVVDSFEGSQNDGDALVLPTADGVSYSNNMYGAAFLGDFGPAKLQVWAAHMDRMLTLYAADFKFTADLGDRNNVGVKVTYLGNSVTEKLKGLTIKGGNLVDGRVNLKFSGFDARIGGIFFGNKNNLTINTLEDITGPDLLIGKEMFYKGSTWIVSSTGQNLFGYIGAGYTIPAADVRLGVQFVGGQNTLGVTGGDDRKNTKYEGVFEASWKATKGLTFSGYYSYLAQNTDNGSGLSDTNDNKQAVRLEALYKF